LWAVYGDYTADYNRIRWIVTESVKFNGWLNIPYKDVLGAQSLTRILVNPSNENEVYASSFLGITQIRERYPKNFIQSDEQRFRIVNLVGPTYIDIRINGTAFDKSGNLWVTNSRIKNGLKVLKTNGQWQSYAMDGNHQMTIILAL
jgi:hypothetical protein